MDYTLAAPKLLISQLHLAKCTTREDGLNVHNVGGLIFQRIWIQGVIVPGPEGVTLLDDGSGVIQLVGKTTDAGSYVLVVGGLCPAVQGLPMNVKVHKLVDLSQYPNREALWFLEVFEAHQSIYDALVHDR